VEFEDSAWAAAAAAAAAAPCLPGQQAGKRQRLEGGQERRKSFNECEEEEGDHEVIIGSSDEEAGPQQVTVRRHSRPSGSKNKASAQPRSVAGCGNGSRVWAIHVLLLHTLISSSSHSQSTNSTA
jgi:hypothetical protein